MHVREREFSTEERTKRERERERERERGKRLNRVCVEAKQAWRERES